MNNRDELIRYELFISMLGKLTSNLLGLQFRMHNTKDLDIRFVFEEVNESANDFVESVVDDFEAYHPEQFDSINIEKRTFKQVDETEGDQWLIVYLRKQ